jgi:hypothetical protein
MGQIPEPDSIAGNIKTMIRDTASEMGLRSASSTGQGSETYSSEKETAEQTCRGILLGDQQAPKEVLFPVPETDSTSTDTVNGEVRESQMPLRKKTSIIKTSWGGRGFQEKRTVIADFVPLELVCQ